MAAKNALKAAGLAGLENLVQSLMPEIVQKLSDLEKSLSSVREEVASLNKKLDARANDLERMIDNRVHELEIKMYDRFESTRDVINEVGSRVNGVDKKLDAYVSVTRDTAGAYKDLLERVVRIEMIQNPKRKRAS